MVRFIAIFLFFFCLTIAVGQVKGDLIEITEERLKNLTSVDELIPGLPKDCKVKKAEISFHQNGHIKIASISEKDGIKSLHCFNIADQGSIIYLDVIAFSCKSSLNKSYKFKVLK